MLSSVPRVAFFSLTKVLKAEHHADHNTWHQLDHRPENLALDGVAFGERFVLTPSGARSAIAEAQFADFHYANMYWFDDPIESAIAEWSELAEQTFREGRRPEIAWVDRPYMGFFRRVGTHIAPHVEVSPRGLCFRPVTGILLSIGSVSVDATRLERQAHNRWQEHTALPTLAAFPGVAGVWSFESAAELAPRAWQEREASSADMPDQLCITMVALEQDPETVLDALGASGQINLLSQAETTVRRPLFCGPLETITPWNWAWFDPEGEDA